MSDRLYRFLVDYADRHHDFRVARHPSESIRYFLTRVLAYVLHYETDLTFSRGVCIGKEPALFTPPVAGCRKLWIDIGRPSGKKLTQGLRRAERVIVYGYGNPEPFRKTLSFPSIKRLQVFWLPTDFLDQVAVTVSTPTIYWKLSLEGDRITINGICTTRCRLW